MANQTPDYTAYTVIKREGAEDYWLAIGAAWKHQQGDGLSLLLQAMPIPGDGQCRIVLRPPKAQANDDVKGAQQEIRQVNERRKSTSRSS